MWRRSSKPRRLLPAVAKAAWQRPSPTPFRWAIHRCPRTTLSSPIPSRLTPSLTQCTPMGTATRTTFASRPEGRKHQERGSCETRVSPCFTSALRVGRKLAAAVQSCRSLMCSWCHLRDDAARLHVSTARRRQNPPPTSNTTWTTLLHHCRWEIPSIAW